MCVDNDKHKIFHEAAAVGEDDGDVNIQSAQEGEDIERAISKTQNLSILSLGRYCEKSAIGFSSNEISGIISRRSDPSLIDAGPPPDGGLTAWTQAAMLHLTILSTFGYTTAFGSFQTYYQSVLGVSPSTISWLGSVQIFLLFFIGTFSGRALDAGLFRPVYITGSIMQLIGIFSTSVATKYWQLFLSQALCMGIANGLHFTPTMGLASTYFEKRRALVLGIGALGSCTGGVLFPVLIQQLLPRIGFGWTVRIIGFVMVATNAITIAFYRTRLPPRRSGPIVEWAAFKETPYVLYCAAAFFFFWGLYFAFFYIGAYGRDQLGMSYEDSVNLLLAMICTGFIWRLLVSFDSRFVRCSGLLTSCFCDSPIISQIVLDH